MPGFFMIAGFFAQFTLRKYGRRKFLGHRMKRLLVPLFFSVLIINSLQAYLLHVIHGGTAGDLALFLGKVLPGVYSEGDWASHLWFLNYLILYSVCTALVSRLRIPGLETIAHKLAGPLGFLRKNLRILWLLGMVSLVPPVLSKLAPSLLYHDLYGFGRLSNILEYLPFFLFGLWLFADEQMQREFTRVRAWHVALFAAVLASLYLTREEGGGIAIRLLHQYALALMPWLAVLFCFALFKRFFDRPSPIFFYLSDASYTIYLFHHVCMVGFGYLLTLWAGPIAVKFLLLVLAVTALTAGIHHFLMLRFDPLRRMFNGRPNPRPRG
jgi:glucan biosynthesis protein C